MQINFKIDSSSVLKQLQELGADKQAPFIMAKGINLLAKQVQKDLRQNLADSLKLRHKQWIFNQVRIDSGTWASKTRLKVTIYVSDAASFLERMEEGAERVPILGRHFLAFPNSKVFKLNIIGKDDPLRIANLALEHKQRGIQGLQRTFLINAKSTGTPLILQRVDKDEKGKKRRGIRRSTGVRLLYTLVKLVRIPKKIAWYSTAQQTVDHYTYSTMSQVMSQALKDTKVA